MTTAPFCLVLLTAASAIVAACGHQAAVAEDVAIEWTITPQSPVAGGATLAEIRLRDRNGQPIHGARLHLEGHMAHPGMAPVMAAAVERDAGVYQIRLQFTMPGSWILLVTGTLPDGRRLEHRIDASVTIATAPSD